MARKPKLNQPQGDEENTQANAPAVPASEDKPEVPVNGPKRTVHDGGIVSLDY